MSTLPTPTDYRIQRLARIARYATVLLIACFFIATHVPPQSIPRQIAGADKLAHCAIYLTISFSVLLSWELATGVLLPQHYFFVWLLGTVYGAFDEVTQIPVGRRCDGLDWCSDILGIILGMTLYRLVQPLIHRYINRSVAVSEVSG